MNRKELRSKKKEISVLGEVVKIVRQYFPELIEKFEEEIEKDGTLTKLNSYDLLRAVINDLEELLED